MNDQARRDLIIDIAKQWLGTPYRHQGSAKGIGCDCLGLVRGVWRELYGHEPEATGEYSMDWAEAGGDEKMLNAARRHFRAADVLRPGSLIVFRWRTGTPAKHLGIYTGNDRFIHAYERSAVLASPLVPQWRKRIAAIFDFPESSFDNSTPAAI
jgi:NlpC/P60 family putative phage cell wall peptidase